ncbi:MAG TPA: ornithine cyclodeaminase family protein [Pseudolabrys sp.]|uniref:ornithine cyclodeaminase family protein n=1 Tax=Pseudolabrys sp. TaxID=1960880 RepID=UPI002DDCA5DD|nr:ornithine cyclodeaminase family protein [Pseudolabrys sp.]HEV2629112.1 ornithine cyclodeaminase family protein [Pseudolabrys sp.]
MPVLLKPQELHGLVDMESAIDAVSEAYRGAVEFPVINAPRRRVHAPTGVRVSNFPGGVHSLGVIGSGTRAELVRQADGNQHYDFREHPVHVLCDSNTSQLMGIVLGEVTEKTLGPSSLMAFRTAATSGVGFRFLAPRNAKAAGVFGSGGQAAYQLLALLTERPQISKVFVYSRSPENRKAFAERYSKLFGVDIQPVEDARAVVEPADVIVCATNTNKVLFDGAWLRPGQHVTGIIGGNIQLVEGGFLKQSRRELDNTTAQRANVIVTNLRESILSEKQGDLWEPLEKGLIKLADIFELGELAAGDKPGRTDETQITYHKNNNGTGAADLALTTLAYRKAIKAGRGMDIAM